MNLNKATIIGRLTRDPEARTTQSGQQVTSFGVATNRVWIDQSGQKKEQTEFHNVVTWGKLADIMSKYLVKGQEVYVEGRIQTRSWEGQDGVKKYRTEINAQNVQMGSKPRGAGNSQPQQNQPQQAQPKPAPEQQQQQAPAQNAGTEEEEINIEDIPF